MNRETKEVSWKDLFGNPYLKKLHPDMATDKGYKTLESVRLKGMSHHEPKEHCLVHYDREYVMKWLIVNYFKPLRFATWNEAQKILSEGFKEYKAEIVRVSSTHKENT